MPGSSGLSNQYCERSFRRGSDGWSAIVSSPPVPAQESEKRQMRAAVKTSVVRWRRQRSDGNDLPRSSPRRRGPIRRSYQIWHCLRLDRIETGMGPRFRGDDSGELALWDHSSPRKYSHSLPILSSVTTFLPAVRAKMSGQGSIGWPGSRLASAARPSCHVISRSSSATSALRAGSKTARPSIL